MKPPIGGEIEVLIDEVDEEGAIGRSWGDAQEIGGAVYLNGETDLQPGDKLVTHADEYDLWADLTSLFPPIFKFLQVAVFAATLSFLPAVLCGRLRPWQISLPTPAPRRPPQ